MNEHLQELKSGGRPMTKLELANKEIERLKEKVGDLVDTIIEREEEIERLNKRYKEIYDGYIAIVEELSDTAIENELLHSIIKEVREYIEKELDIEKICRQEKSLTICKKGLLNILDKVGEE